MEEGEEEELHQYLQERECKKYKPKINVHPTYMIIRIAMCVQHINSRKSAGAKLGRVASKQIVWF